MRIISILVLFLSLSAFAQETKVGTIDIDFILSKMPELANVQKQVQDYKQTLEVDLQKMVTNYETKLQKTQEELETLTLMQKQQKQDSLIAMENDINKFQQNGNQLILLRQEEFMQPLYKKVGEALEVIAKEGGYTQVLLRDNNVVYVDNRFDLTIAVLKHMGIEVKPEE